MSANRRRWRGAVLPALLGVLLAAGCGIPDDTDVRVDGQGPAPGLPTGGQGAQTPASRLDERNNTEAFVLNFLQAPAVEAERAVEQVRDFVAPLNRADVKDPNPEVVLTVIRLRERPRITRTEAGVDEVSINVQQVGQLRPNGALEPLPAQEPEFTEYTFRVGSVVGESGKFILNPPPVLLLSENALRTFYWQRTIYFWDTSQRALVPDLRYLPVAVPVERQRTVLLEALISGPSNWIAPAVQALPSGTRSAGNVPDTGDRLKVSLTAEATPGNDPDQLDRLAAQLMWSLRPDFGNDFELTIQGQSPKVYRGADLLAMNSTQALPETPERFVIHQGQVRRLRSSARSGEPIPVLTAEVNQNVVSAGFTRAGGSTFAALAVQAVDGQRLVIGSATAAGTHFEQGDRSFASIGRPVWLKAPADVGLIVADGALYSFEVNSRAVTQVALPGIEGEVQSVGVAPDGHRIALVVAGELYVAALSRGTHVEVLPPRRIPTSLLDVTQVDWVAETLLVAAGTNPDGRVTLYDITVDGAIETSSPRDLGGASVTHLAGYPANPISGSSVGVRMYVANGIPYDLFEPSEQIRLEEVEGIDPSATPDPVTVVDSANGLSAPFFLY
ncbi:LpqB family beta-propeller domain-containing protein [Solwaraspora sp. WMMD406]|uniref:LpqB family beta-propeller domain-containing protein n=1 Tax=Solwaraspora sp. WMMD406 TaxID=3016095 RepID=UPI00241659DB|nr:LpqB family beta-propeller domain-containing protein [Solwaraspora sp. WMMD406]MDG4763938.1 LpqB family beta-propeller domain-containing protein [Solwaraspora sp. WMMD406]